MALKLYNTLGRKIEPFRPLRGKTVRLYTCGPTVYDYAHIGNLRTYIFEDILKRTLLINGWRVKHIMNITDVDDKTIRRSKAARKNLKEFTERYTQEFFSDIKKLNILSASTFPRATDHIPEMIAMIAKLIKKGYAYEAADGIYFDISRYKNYGKLSGVAKRELKAGARVNTDEYAKNEAKDFALWKKKKGAEPSWPSPFGEGRPGWHIECSAIAVKYLGLPIDIHAGGVDLIFPHHENEIAQSEGAFGKKFARFFLEGEHLMVERKKMSKSLDNFLTLRDFISRGFDPLDFRYFVLGTHYRKPLSFSWKALEGAKIARNRISGAIVNKSSKKDASLKKAMLEAVNNDLGTPKALAIFWQAAGDGISKSFALWADHIFGLGIKNSLTAHTKTPAEILALARSREMLRKEKRWKEADEIREKIEKSGFKIQDTTKGAVIHKI